MNYTYIKESTVISAIDDAGTAQHIYRTIGRKVNGGYWCVPTDVYRAMSRAASDARYDELYDKYRVYIIPNVITN